MQEDRGEVAQTAYQGLRCARRYSGPDVAPQLREKVTSATLLGSLAESIPGQLCVGGMLLIFLFMGASHARLQTVWRTPTILLPLALQSLDSVLCAELRVVGNAKRWSRRLAGISGGPLQNVAPHDFVVATAHHSPIVHRFGPSPRHPYLRGRRLRRSSRPPTSSSAMAPDNYILPQGDDGEPNSWWTMRQR